MKTQDNAAERGGEVPAQKAISFSVVHRNYGHWDICFDRQRLFRIRGGPGKYVVLDEREGGKPQADFKTVAACMSYICDELMFELIVAEGQSPTIIESWNV